MGQKKEKYARWKDKSVVELQERVRRLEREAMVQKHRVNHQKVALENLENDIAVSRAAERYKRDQEARRREQRRAAQMARSEQRRDEQRKCRTVAAFLMIVVGMMLALLCMPELEGSPAEAPAAAAVRSEELGKDYVVATLVQAHVEPAGRYDSITEEEKELLARLIWAEARGECAEGQQAVAEVVLNRVAADNFPDTVREVIYEGQGTSCPQFSTAGMLGQAEPTAAQYEAVERALQGGNILPVDVVYFSREGENDQEWGTIGNHVFCYQYIWM
ncbi:MAG: cell wall hydrolase [Oscillibacter sp.]|nr:cell wall hydrolase [Oscillibacter sp.]